MSDRRFDYAVIGGGIVGLSVAWNLLEREPQARLLVLEKEDAVGRHQTGRNSGVIHSGIYYKPGSLKAKLCREGNRRLLEFCDRHGVAYDICGKVIVATTQAEISQLDKIHQRGIDNGLEVHRLSAAGVREIEPHVQCLEGVRVPSTGIIDYTAVCAKLVELIQARGGEVRFNARVTGIHPKETEVTVETARETLTARRIVNCAGLQSDRMAKLAGAKPDAKIVPFRGEYYELKPERRSLVKHLIYPVPDPEFPFLGVHFTRMMDGSVHAGPNAVLSFKREGYFRTSFDLRDFVDTMTYPGFWRMAGKHARAGLEEIHRSYSKPAFVRALQKLIPEVRSEDLIPSGTGVRAQALCADGKLVDDFLIVNGGPAVHVCNAPSPAATASLEIGRHVVETVLNHS